jgi:hypothetical protein
MPNPNVFSIPEYLPYKITYFLNRKHGRHLDLDSGRDQRSFRVIALIIDLSGV